MLASTPRSTPMPVARSVLRRIGDGTDVVTFVSSHTRSRFASAFGPAASLPTAGSGHRPVPPDPAARAELRKRLSASASVYCSVICRGWCRARPDTSRRPVDPARRVDGAALVIVGGGPYLETLSAFAHDCGVADHVTFTGGVATDELPAHHAPADVFAMPCRTCGAGMDVEGLGIVPRSPPPARR